MLERLLLLLPTAGGAALVTHILLGISLRAGLLLLLAFNAALWTFVCVRAPAATRRRLRARVVSGLKAGLAGTIAYDACRFGVVALLAFSFEPFHVWSIFGRLLVGPDAAPATTWIAGAGFHLANGLGFAVAFALLVRRPTWRLGILWGIGLELAMALLYPAWLRIAALQEFLTVSALGHVVYGAVMGLALQRMLGDPGHRRLAAGAAAGRA